MAAGTEQSLDAVRRLARGVCDAPVASILVPEPAKASPRMLRRYFQRSTGCPRLCIRSARAWRKRWNEGSLRYSPDETYANAPARRKGLIYASVRITSRPVASKNTTLGL